MRGWIGQGVAWSGGVVFATSLALAAWHYAVVFVREAEGPRGRAIAVDVALLTLFALHHSLFARPAGKAVVGRLVPATLIRSAYVWIASLLFIAVMLWWQPVGGVVYRVSGAGALVFSAVQLAGAWLIVGAVRAIRALELAGIHPPREHAGELNVDGPYVLVRHPLYLGWVLLVGATSHLTGDRLLFAAVTTLYIVIAIPWEERGLAAEFGDAYARYRREVRWRVVPYVY